jgi:hypothetical protein
MTISLSQMIADLNAKIAAADSNTPIATILEYVTEAERLTGGKVIYTTALDLPTGDSAYEGSIAYVANDQGLRVRGHQGWASITDSAATEEVVAYSFQGSTSGYNSGVFGPTGNVIDKFSFASDGNATDVGDMTTVRTESTGNNSSTHGYFVAGRSPVDTSIIESFPFAVDGNSTEVGNIVVQVYSQAGQSSEFNGYASAGSHTLPTPYVNTIQKFSFSAGHSSAVTGNLTVARGLQPAGQSSSDNGYTSGGFPDGRNVIDKFPFSTDANATDVGDLLANTYSIGGGQSSTTHGYVSGGVQPGVPTRLDVIQKFSFATDGNASDVGDLTLGRSEVAGQSSTASGYTSGGEYAAPSSRTTTIDKFPFSSDANATDVGDLLIIKFAQAGTQV